MNSFPHMEILSTEGRTAIVFRVAQGLVGKMPRDMHKTLAGHEEFVAEVDNAFAVEKRLLDRLGDHPRIIRSVSFCTPRRIPDTTPRYHGLCTVEGMKDGLLLDEANCGDLQSYIDKHNAKIDTALRKRWCLQVAQAVAHAHDKGVIHSNLGTRNVLVHRNDRSLDLLLADFGGSRCVELDLDGGLLPDDPFFDPCLRDYNSPKLDIFSLGIIFYVIMTGHFPFYDGPAPQNEERFIYGDHVHALFEQGQFPDLSDVPFGRFISGCCCERRFEDAKAVVAALQADNEM